jgi:hypothetical protein
LCIRLLPPTFSTASVKSGNAHIEPMMSAFHPKATEQRTQFYVGFVPTADIRIASKLAPFLVP